MADSKKPKLERITLPRGIAVYPKLATPDEYKGKKKYSIGVKFKKTDVEKLLASLTEKAEAYLAETKEKLTKEMGEAKGAKKADLKKKIEGLTLHLPFKPDFDDDGNENDYVIIKSSMNDHFKDKAGKVVPLRPDLYDSKAVKLKKPIDVWGGSEVKVNAAILPTYVDASGACGITLRLQGVQILVLRQGGASAESMGFSKEEDGFDAGDVDAPEDFSGDDKSGGDGSGEEEQF